MDWERYDPQIQARAKTVALFIFLDAIALLMFGLAWTFVITCWVLAVIAFNFAIRMQRCQSFLDRLVRQWRNKRLRYSYYVVLAFALLTVALWRPAVNAAYVSGQFGEPPDNRYWRLHPAEANHVLIEFGVKSTPLGSGFGVLIKLNADKHEVKKAWFDNPGSYQSFREPATIRTGQMEGDPTVLRFDPLFGNITPTRSFFMLLNSDVKSLEVVDCGVRDHDESIVETRLWSAGEVKRLK